MGKRSREYIYGINSAYEVVRAGRRTVYAAFINQGSAEQPRMLELVQFLELNEVPIEYVDKKRLDELTPRKEHQGAILKAGVYSYASSETLFEREKLLLIDGIEDPQNVGVILRSAEVFGFNAVLLPEKGVPEIYPSIVRVSSGATEFLDISRDMSAADYAKTAKEAGFKIAALDGAGDVMLKEAAGKLTGRFLLVIGGEDSGVSKEILEMADLIVSIRQQGSINSLNASVAAGIAMSHLA